MLHFTFCKIAVLYISFCLLLYKEVLTLAFHYSKFFVPYIKY